MVPQCQGDEKVTGADVRQRRREFMSRRGRLGEVHSSKKCRMTRHDAGMIHWRFAGVREQEVSDRN